MCDTNEHHRGIRSLADTNGCVPRSDSVSIPGTEHNIVSNVLPEVPSAEHLQLFCLEPDMLSDL